MNNKNVEIIQDVYSAFSQGDVQTILSQTEDDTEWRFNVTDSEVPWHTMVEGRNNLPQFFNNLMGNVEMTAFEPRQFIASGNDVIAHIHIAYKIRKTGRDVDMEQLHWWTLNDKGKIERLVHFEDTAQVFSAYKGSGG